MPKRIVIYSAILVCFVACSWIFAFFKTRQLRSSLDSFVADEDAQLQALNDLGDVELDPLDLSFATLENKLGQPRLRKLGSHDSSIAGWACGKERCAIWASFLVHFGQEIPNSSYAVAIELSEPLGKKLHRLSIGGIYPGESIADARSFCEQRGYGVPAGQHKLTWNRDWNFVWADMSGRVGLLVFMNEKKIQESAAREALPRGESR